ncbi:hypothetical protein [uncultured Desulfovibrio sp.]|uniref:hypothetical protein n=1 Tax=uncultured Desulfovibrio sp. TaxID=167968 RepID=UPI002626169F|nr:hypothetical protein [uncultured Desulfovibrio sp.]
MTVYPPKMLLPVGFAAGAAEFAAGAPSASGGRPSRIGILDKAPCRIGKGEKGIFLQKTFSELKNTIKTAYY